MPIRINLLAEEQAAEEMRRRDPIKRALLAGAGLAIVMLFWIGITQMNVIGARRELADYESRLKKVDDASKQVRNNSMAASEYQEKLKALEKYATNRFLWGTVLDALQHTTVDHVRLVDLKAEQKYGVGEIQRFFSTNVILTLPEQPAWWKFWARASAQESIDSMASAWLPGITNKAPFVTNQMHYSVKISPVSTNVARQQVVTQLDFNNPPWAMEKTTIEIRGRDYGNPPGAAIDEFARRITSSPVLKDVLVPVEGFRFTERPPQARPDPQDPLNPEALFVPFTIELTLTERIFPNE